MQRFHPLKKIFLAAFTLSLALWLVRCAGQIPPPGGDVDRIPPRVVWTEPDSDAVRVNTDRVVLEFSEYVDRRSVEQAVFISPWPGDVEYEWSGTEVTVLFPEPLRKNRTYVVNVGTDVIDRRERNRMAAGFTLAFSTGDSIDQGCITGRVFDDKPEGVMVFAYALDGINPDTLNPGKLRPDYVTQTGKQGAFTLSNLALGPYRVVAVRDEFHDLLYGIQADQYGVPTTDLLLSSMAPRMEGVRIQLSQEDTSHPFLTGVQALNSTMIQVRFSEAIDSLSVGRTSVTIADTLSGALLEPQMPYLLREAPSTLIVPLTQPMDSGAAYQLRVGGLKDRAGNALDSTNASAAFTATTLPDTVPPGWKILGVTDSLRGYPPAQPLLVLFSEPVEHQPAVGGITVRESSMTPAGFDARWLGPADLALNFTGPLKSRNWYAVNVILDSLRDLRGNVRRDSTRKIRFETLDMKSTGTIEGWVRDSSRGKGEYVVIAKSVGVPDPFEQKVRLAHPGAFQLRDLPEGLYAVWGFKDNDGSGVYSPGLPFPFVPSEPFAVLADTLKVRARWGVEGVALILR